MRPGNPRLSFDCSAFRFCLFVCYGRETMKTLLATLIAALFMFCSGATDAAFAAPGNGHAKGHMDAPTKGYGDLRPHETTTPSEDFDANVGGSGSYTYRQPACDSGLSDRYVRVVYAHPLGTVSREPEVRAEIQALVGQVNGKFYQTALNNTGNTGVDLKVRCAADGSVMVSTITWDPATQTEPEVPDYTARGWWNNTTKVLTFIDENYANGRSGGVAWTDHAHGDGTIKSTTSPANDGYYYAHIYSWNVQTIAHELMHTQSTVAKTAPHYNAYKGSHCYDEWDIMCYTGTGGLPLTYPCPDLGPANSVNEPFDCGADDYAHGAATSGYLATHWDALGAENVWLVRSPGTIVQHSPTANAGANRSTLGQNETASAGFASAEDADCNLKTFAWTNTAKPVLSNPQVSPASGTTTVCAWSAPSTSFTNMTVAGRYTFQLKVTDTTGRTATDTVDICSFATTC